MDRFILLDVKPAMIRCYDRLLDCQWVLSPQFWWTINSTTMDSDKNSLVSDALHEQAINCIIHNF